MKRLAVASLFVSVGAFVACAVEEAAPPELGQGGTTTVGGAGGAGAQGGTGGSGQAGSNTGATGGSAGVGATGGSAGMTGGTSPGGMAGSGGTGGSGPAGMGGMAGDGMSGAGPAGMGGMDGGMAGMDGGMAGMAGGGPTCPSVAELFPAMGNLGSLDGRLIMTPCQDNPSTDDCNSDGWYYNGTRTACSGGQLTVQQDFPVAGEPGQMYQVTMHFYGVMEPKNYGGNVTREAAPGRPGNQNTGASPPPWATCNTPGCNVPTSTYNTYEIHVFNNTNQEIGTYFLNADTQEPHITYAINFEKTIPVVGGGRVRMRTFDSNCRQIKNCGSQPGYPCASKVRTIDISGAMPQPMMGALPQGFSQPGLGESNDHAGQWFLTDVVSVACQ